MFLVALLQNNLPPKNRSWLEQLKRTCEGNIEKLKKLLVALEPSHVDKLLLRQLKNYAAPLQVNEFHSHSCSPSGWRLKLSVDV